ncbi:MULTISPECIES: hypothetical protein [unclassified Sinorhizobium]|uniref:hypothetical protein n=1 Tax=unclassified Sinorhizobium TaxID=2613772 RepID=UPI00352656B6
MEDVPVIKTRRKGKSQTQSMLIPSERMVVDELRAAQPGHLSDLAELRRALAAKYGADACCPVTMQRHLVRISQDGSAPFWRVVDPDRPFARRMTGGPERIREALAAER